MGYLICDIWDDRPKVCRVYPTRSSYMPDSCGYYFTAEGRKGSCYMECQGACCALPRQNGEPGGAPLPELAGGEPCKHLVDSDVAPAGALVDKEEA